MIRNWRLHLKFLLAFLFGLILFGATSLTPLDGVVRALAGVNGFFVCYLALAWHTVRGSSPEALRRHAEADDEGAAVILTMAVLSIAISLGAIFMVLNRPGLAMTEALFALASAPLGWAMIHTLAAFRYAHLYYAPDPDAGLVFPGTDKPVIGDFMYFSYVVGMTAQVSDVQVTESRLRRVVLVHSIGSFFFNTVILALAVNAALALSK
jgi:uncharacterized membrane protein